MAVRFSLIYPTRHRPAFIGKALQFLECQQYKDFEVIISDNYTDPAFSCQKECLASSLTHLKYVRPPKPVGMVENWNYALQFATGDYICYLTDKMFLLPDALTAASICIEKSQAEIVSWVDDSYAPKSFPDYFGEGQYVKAASSIPSGVDFATYDPLDELSNKGRADVSRPEQDKSFYARGKICFGAYSADLRKRVVAKTGALFHNICPDYTSMVLGLSMATSAIEISQAGIVHVQTDLSNGGLCGIHDNVAFKFISELGCVDDLMSNLLVPGLYCATHNLVTFDYMSLKKKYDLDFSFDPINWLVYITEDLDIEGRKWSAKEVASQQRGILQDYIADLSKSERARYRKKLVRRARTRKNVKRMRYLRSIIKSILPESIIETITNDMRFSNLLTRRQQIYCANISDIL